MFFSFAPLVKKFNILVPASPIVTCLTLQIIANTTNIKIIIIAEDNEVLFEANTLVDPYNSSYASKVDIGATIEDKILDAFEAYVDDAFKFGNYYTFYFENQNKFEAGKAVEEPGE